MNQLWQYFRVPQASPDAGIFANAAQIVAQQVNNHQIFSAIFLAGKKRRYGSLRLLGVSRRGSLDRTGKNLVARDPEKSLGRITQDRALRRLDEGAERRAAASQAVVDHFRRFIAALGPTREKEG